MERRVGLPRAARGEAMVDLADELALARQECRALRAQLKDARDRLASAEQDNVRLRSGAVAIVAKIGESVPELYVDLAGGEG